MSIYIKTDSYRWLLNEKARRILREMSFDLRQITQRLTRTPTMTRVMIRCGCPGFTYESK